eukprot:g4880.t1
MKSQFRLLALTSAVLCASAASKCVPKYVAGTHSVDIDVGGVQRRFLLLVPDGVDVAAGLPAVVSIHGYSSNPYYYGLLAGHARYNNDQYYNETDPTAEGSFEYLQSGYKWLFALPFGTATQASPSCCPSSATQAECESGRLLDKANPCAFNAGSCCGTAPARGVDDVGFARALAAFLTTSMCANTDQLFAMGFSNGGMMTNRIGCELADTFRAIAPFDGPIKTGGGGFEKCAPARPMSVVQFCGAADSVCNGGIASTMNTWAGHAHCDTAKATLSTYESATTHCQKYQGCAESALVEWCIIDGLGHEFSGHLRPGNAAASGKAPDFGYQPATNVDGFRYVMNRFSTLL